MTMSRLRPKWPTNGNFAHRPAYPLIDKSFKHTEAKPVTKANNPANAEAFFSAKFGLYNVHPPQGEMDYLFVSKMPNTLTVFTICLECRQRKIKRDRQKSYGECSRKNILECIHMEEFIQTISNANSTTSEPTTRIDTNASQTQKEL